VYLRVLAVWAGIGITALAVASDNPTADDDSPRDEVLHEAPAAHPPTPALNPAVPASAIIAHGRPQQLRLRSSVALVRDQTDGVVMLAHSIDEQRPIASLTKLMTAIVVLDAAQPFDEPIEITTLDRDRLKGSRSRLQIGSIFTRRELLHVALAASDNRAAAALARSYPGGQTQLVRAMNDKARQFGMTKTRFVEATGLDKHNVSTARDLAKLAAQLDSYPIVRMLSTTAELTLYDQRHHASLEFFNTNPYVRNAHWQVDLSKTGYISEAGNCLLMTSVINNRPVTLVLLNAWGKMSPYGDSTRIRDWLTRTERQIEKQSEKVARAAL
jgi:D-alanyl-D-alanine endopeptidase (penicillin-binding protein 7)